MKPAVFLITLTLWALLAVACSATPAADPRKLVPPDATFVAEVRVADILQDRDLAKLYDALSKATGKATGAPQTIQGLLASITRMTGLDMRTVQSAVLFGAAAANDSYAGAILRGQFGEPGLVSAFVTGSPGLTATRYKDRQVYVGEDGDASRAFALLSKDLLAVGSLPAVQSVIDVHRGDRAPVSGKVWDTFQSLGTPLFRLAAQVPSGGLSHLPAPLGNLPGLGSIPLGAGALDSLEIVGVAVDKTGRNLKLHAQLNFRDPDSADRAEGLLSGALSLLRGFTSDRQVRDILDQVQVKVSGARLDVLLQASVAELQALAAGSDSRP